MGSDKELEEYERDYLKRLEERKNADEIQNIHNPTPDYYEEKVESVDYVIMADREDMEAWVSGDKYIQEALPYLTAAERELLISQTCDNCWQEMYDDVDNEK